MDAAQVWSLIAVAAAGACAALVAYAVFAFVARARAHGREVALREIVVTGTRSPVVRALLPAARRVGLGLHGAADASQGGMVASAFRALHRQASQKLASAGHPEGVNADEYLGFAVLSTATGVLVGAVVFILLEPMGPVLLCGLGAVIGAVWMPRWLKRRRVERHTAIRKELPFSLDLLTLAMEAGLDFTSALDRICRKLGDSPLGDEYQIMLREIRLGKGRSDALRDLARRVDVLEVQSVVSSLVQAEEMGANIGPILRLQAEQQRERRSQRAETAAGQAPVKMLLPLILFMAITFLLIFGPMMIRFLE